MNHRSLIKNFLSNSEMFVSTFNCKEGSRMNHPVKCERFPNLIKNDYYDMDPLSNENP